MSKDYRKILGEAPNVMMSESLHKTVSQQKSPQLVITHGTTEILVSYRVHSFQKNANGLLITCALKQLKATVEILASASPDDVMTLDYCGVKFKNYTCHQWGIVSSDLDLHGENKLELIFEHRNNQALKDILND